MTASAIRMLRFWTSTIDAGSSVGSADADGVEPAAVAQGDLAELVDAVVADPVVGVVAAVADVALGRAV